MTPQEHAHVQALNEARTYFGAHELCEPRWMEMRAAWIAKREMKLNATNEGKTK